MADGAVRIELVENAPQRLDARRLWIASGLDGLGQQVEEHEPLLFSQVEVRSSIIDRIPTFGDRRSS